MKIIITGASGSIGRALVPYLHSQGHDLLLAGRNADRLQALFPAHKCADYRDLSGVAAGYDACIHLAVKNNGDGGDLKSFRAANVSALQHIFGEIQQAGVKHFINLTSFHAANPKQNDPYAISKREGDTWLAEQTEVAAKTPTTETRAGMKITALRLPAVYSADASGNLAKVNRLPKFLRPPALAFLGAVKPMADMGRVVAAIADALQDGTSQNAMSEDRAVANPQENNLIFTAFKKIVDLGFALSSILLLWWLFLIIFILIKMTSKGPAIFAQERTGRHGKSFICYKFRTMRVGTKQAGTHDVDGSAITGIGAFLRKTKIDELPQIFNILRGDLSLVGPRPCLPVQRELIAERQKRGVLQILPGITGWAQINDIDMSDPVRLAQADADYIARRTIPFELSIIFKTFTGSGQGDRVKEPR